MSRCPDSAMKQAPVPGRFVPPASTEGFGDIPAVHDDLRVPVFGADNRVRTRSVGGSRRHVSSAVRVAA